MATNRHALIRYRIIDQCLRRKERTYHLKDLIEACSEAISKHEGRATEIKRRTLLYDLKFMKDDNSGFNAPIAYDRTDGYYYTINDFSIFNIAIKRTDLEVLRHVLTDLKRISGNSAFEDLETVIIRLEETYNITPSRNAKPVVQFEHSTNVEGQKHVTILKGYIMDKQPLQITYEPFDSKPYVRNICPYLLKEYNNRWFLIGHEYDADWSITTLGLDRIKKIAKSIRPYYEHPSFDSDTYLKDVVGVSIHEDAIKTLVTFKAYGRSRHYVDTKPVHHSQKCIEMTDDYGKFTVDVIPNIELQARLLSYGEAIEVLGPEGFREKVKRRLSGAVGRYD